ncbi:MAG: YqgE/AlgH family protein [Bacteroidota bacterium]
MTTHTLRPTAGRLLISEPSLQDFYFRKAVILLAEHNNDGSFGIIINKPVEIKLNDVVTDFPDFPARVFLGGPVKTDSLFFIHTCPEKITDSLQIIKGIYWGGDIEQVHELILNHAISPEEIKFYIGYSGWSPKQLDLEMEKNSWVVSKLTADILIKEQPEDLWSKMMKSMGGDYPLYANFPVDPNWN